MSNEKKSLKTLEHGRAQFAFKCVENAINVLGNKKGEYKSYVKKIPMLIKTNGLGLTFAFILSKKAKSKAYEIIGENILNWLKRDEKRILKDASKIENFDGLVKTVTMLESSEYMALSNEVLAFFNWLRRFAEGLIEDEEDENRGDGNNEE
ncbi:CRISPR-associated protein Cmr5 [Thermosipho sp. 1063]|uniref:type III-B CRISPR module-associated protein Cmr5 n=1 Tax=unclassified Thermosipho (in: thermotogales) TaxID=2676525 RepID=UPI0009507EE3|nr:MULTISPECIES: type III-B CRISPR module-associated protein Cmr5 [unclassified Thermosipho (in: thermotogales)]APT72103.1 CRISPR-associated protein Cmr5 [Thermosipho sp. 1063]OOC44219.1 hypothetical protein XO08_04095 [Thermosipho sp. 1074]